VSGESVVPAESLLLGTEVTPHLLLSRIVDGVFVSCEIVGSRENSIAGFAGGGIDPLTFVRPILRVPKRR